MTKCLRGKTCVYKTQYNFTMWMITTVQVCICKKNMFICVVQSYILTYFQECLLVLKQFHKIKKRTKKFHDNQIWQVGGAVH